MHENELSSIFSCAIDSVKPRNLALQFYHDKFNAFDSTVLPL